MIARAVNDLVVEARMKGVCGVTGWPDGSAWPKPRRCTTRSPCTMPSARPGRCVARRCASTYRSMAARSGVLAPRALAAAAAGGRVPPSVSSASRAASTVMAARRTTPARNDRIQMLLLEMLVFMVAPLPWPLVDGVGGRDRARGLDDRHRGRSRRRPAGHSSASSPGRMRPTTVTLGMTVSGARTGFLEAAGSRTVTCRPFDVTHGWAAYATTRGSGRRARGDQAGLVGEHHQLRPVAGAQLGQHPAHVGEN